MIRKLRLKFVTICMTLVTAVLVVVFLSVYFATQQNIESLSNQLLTRLVRESTYMTDSGKSRSEVGIAINGDHMMQLPYFTVNVWPNGDSYIADVTGGTYSDLDDSEELTAILTDCLSQNQTSGVVSDYHLRYLRQSNGMYEKLAFVDMSMEQAVLREMMGSYLTIGAAALLLLLGVSFLLSRWATAPVERAWKQQHQFLSDASHELKTPLTVILSNAELLEAAPLDDRPARWADNIHTEARQMRSLVEEMLTLARADNMVRTAVLTELSLSDLAVDCALAFEPVAFEAGKLLDYRLDENVTVLGDRDKLRQLLGILIDNAIKYSTDGGTITLTLQKADRQARLTVANPGPPIPPEQLERLFERFYRADASRGEQSGFGLGLPIASAIAAEHHGALKAESDEISTRFHFTIPLKK